MPGAGDGAVTGQYWSLYKPRLPPAWSASHDAPHRPAPPRPWPVRSGEMAYVLAAAEKTGDYSWEVTANAATVADALTAAGEAWDALVAARPWPAFLRLGRIEVWKAHDGTTVWGLDAHELPEP